MNIALIGCGEVGRCYASALLAAGQRVVRLYDVNTDNAASLSRDLNVSVEPGLGDWLSQADVVISAVFGGVALQVATNVMGWMRPGAIYADFTTAAPDDLREAARLSRQHDVDLVDVAVMGAIGMTGAKTALLCAGSAADSVAALMHTVGAKTTIAGSEPGDAVSLKLLRSIFTKGIEALAIESMVAAEHKGLRNEFYDVLSDMDDAPISHFINSCVTSHVKHAGRRLKEVQEAQQQLRNDGFNPLSLQGVEGVFQRSAQALEQQPFEADPTLDNALKRLDRIVRT